MYVYYTDNCYLIHLLKPNDVKIATAKISPCKNSKDCYYGLKSPNSQELVVNQKQ